VKKIICVYLIFFLMIIFVFSSPNVLAVNKIMSAASLAKIIKSKTNFEKIYFGDKHYIVRSYHYYWKIVLDSFIDRYKRKFTVFDCEDYSLILHAFVRQLQYYKNEELPLAFGEVWLKESNGRSRSHALNIAVTDEGEVILIEPQSNKVRSLNDKDVVYFIRM